ncbi:acetate kinase [soil metagenome]
MPADPVIVVNCGSSSLKLAIIDPEPGEILAKGLGERLGTGDAVLRAGPVTEPSPGADHAGALHRLLSLCKTDAPAVAVGHRVVHGGEYFREATAIDSEVIGKIEDCTPLAPLHNPGALAGIRAARQTFPDLPHVAVFDTAFHQTLPDFAFTYAVPHQWYSDFRVRRYGFHGTSHHFVSREAARLLGQDFAGCQLVVAHLGNGCSTCAVRHGQSVDTSMGLTPLEGLVMGTRSGDVDPNLHQFIASQTGRDLESITDSLNRQSGLLGISGSSNDMRTIAQAAASGDPRAALAIEVFCYRLAQKILAMAAGLDRLDALVFTGGIGENMPAARQKTLGHLRILGPDLDPARNADHGRQTGGTITRHGSPGLRALVVPTNEEWMIAQEAARFAAR